MIHFRKILDYPRTPPAGDEFAYLCALTNQTIDPPTLHQHGLKMRDTVVYASPMRRSRGCIATRPDARVLCIDELKEIPFDLAALCTRTEWMAHKSAIVRERFVDAFVRDMLLTPRAVILGEVESVLHFLQKRPERSITVISHSFRLKVIEAYIKTHGMLATDPTLLGTFIHADTPTYAFGTGFDVSRKDSTF